MAKDFSFVPFKREDHVYHNEAFAELCKDAVRAFNGTPVCELPPPRFVGSGVYAIYCTAKKGIYERYGNKVNRMGYNVPIYVGKAVPKGWHGDGCFETLTCQEQLSFWHHKIKSAIGFSTEDFVCRIFAIDEFCEKEINCVHGMMMESYHPVWNKVFVGCKSLNDLDFQWKQIHSVRFCSKADRFAQKELKRFMEVA